MTVARTQSVKSDFVINQDSIQISTNCKFLGVFVDSKLRLEIILSIFVQYCRKTVEAMFRVIKLVPDVYYTLFYPLHTFGMEWDSSNTCKSNSFTLIKYSQGNLQ